MVVQTILDSVLDFVLGTVLVISVGKCTNIIDLARTIVV